MRNGKALWLAGAAVAAALAAGQTQASESITYGYDPLGRLTTISTTTGPNAGTSVSTGYDPAGNRTNYGVTGAGAAGSAAAAPAGNVTGPVTATSEPAADPMADEEPAAEPPPAAAPEDDAAEDESPGGGR